MKNQTNITTGQSIELKYGNVKISGAVNSPKLNEIAIACQGITAIAGKSGTANLTGFGHKSNCKGGIIDETIFSGKVHSIENFIADLSNSGLKVVENDRIKYANSTFRAVLAKRICDHIVWCSNTLNDSHGGFGSRLEKVGLSGKRSELAELLESLATQIKGSYSQFSVLYKNRNKSGLN